jgi:hypothetical protein
MPGEQQAGSAPGLGGQAETAGNERRLDLDLAQGGDQSPAPQPLFQRPGGIERVSRLDDEKEGGVEAEGDEARTIGAPPFARGALGEAPQYEPRRRVLTRQLPADRGKGEGERRRLVAIGGGLDLVQACRFEPAPRQLPRPRRGREGVRPRCVGVRPNIQLRILTPILPLPGGGRR